MDAKDRARPETFTKLREELFSSDLAAMAPGSDAQAGAGPVVVGVAMEVAMSRGSFLVFGLRDGSASLYLSSGGGAIGGQGRPTVNAAAKQLVETARPFAARWSVATEHPLPQPGRVQFSIFTTAGTRSAVADEAELRSTGGELAPLYAAAHGIITAFRLAEESAAGPGGSPAKPPNGEPAYMNCLLTTLARGTGAPATLTVGQPPPDLAALTADAQDREWIAESAFALDRLDTQQIVDQLSKLAGLGMLRKEGRIQARLAGHGGNDFTDAAFVVTRRKQQGQVQLVITHVRAG